MQSQKAVSAHFTSKQILPFYFAAILVRDFPGILDGNCCRHHVVVIWWLRMSRPPGGEHFAMAVMTQRTAQSVTSHSLGGVMVVCHRPTAQLHGADRKQAVRSQTAQTAGILTYKSKRQ